MEDLTIAAPTRIKVASGERTTVTCPSCAKTVSVSAGVISRFRARDLEVTCLCGKIFHVRFDIRPETARDLRVTVIDHADQHQYTNITVKTLDNDHLSFYCKETHNFRKGHKVRILLVRKGAGPAESSKEAVVRLVRGKYIACFFTSG